MAVNVRPDTLGHLPVHERRARVPSLAVCLCANAGRRSGSGRELSSGAPGGAARNPAWGRFGVQSVEGWVNTSHRFLACDSIV